MSGDTDRRADADEACPLCGASAGWTARFWAAFPERDGEQAAFPLGADPPVPSWSMVECHRCAAVHPRPYPTAAEIGSYYASAAEPNDWEVAHYVRKDLTPGALDGEADLADKVTRLHGGPGRMLEVGCAAGWQLRAAQERGWEVHGVEAAPKFSAFARDVQGLDVFAGPLEEVDPAAMGTFDLILALDVFEHLHDPVAALDTLRQLARPGTRLVLSTPDISSRVARFWGLRWRQILPSHINYSTPASMRAVLARTGWRLERRSEPRWFDPDARRQRRNQVREAGKFAARVVLYTTLVRPSQRWPGLKRVPPVLSAGRISWDRFAFSVGDQPVLGDVMLVVARAA